MTIGKLFVANFVGKITFMPGYTGETTIYISDRDSIILDSIQYNNCVLSIAPIEITGNFDAYNSISSVAATLAIGGQSIYGTPNIDIFTPLSNAQCEIRILDSDSRISFEDCIPYAKGLLKNCKISFDKLSFEIDQIDYRDTIKLPHYTIIDQRSKTTFRTNFIVENLSNCTIEVSDIDLFSEGDVILLYKNDFTKFEYATITSIETIVSPASCILTLNKLQSGYSSALSENFAELAFTQIIDSVVDKKLPITYGDLTDSENGKFGKALLINNQKGFQSILSDSEKLHTLTNLGIYDEEADLFYTGIKEGLLQTGQDEYSLHSDNNLIYFRNDTTTTLSDSTTDSLEYLEVTDYTQILWYDETLFDATYDNAKEFHDIFSNTIIAIDSELMQVIEKPVDSTIYVKRGMFGTTATSHSNGAKVFQCSKLSAKNYLQLCAKFIPKEISKSSFVTPYGFTTNYLLIGSVGAEGNGIIGKIDNILSKTGNTPPSYETGFPAATEGTNCLRIVSTSHASSPWAHNGQYIINLKMGFKKIGIDGIVLNTFVGLNIRGRSEGEDGAYGRAIYINLLRETSDITEEKANLWGSTYGVGTSLDAILNWDSWTDINQWRTDIGGYTREGAGNGVTACISYSDFIAAYEWFRLNSVSDLISFPLYLQLLFSLSTNSAIDGYRMDISIGNLCIYVDFIAQFTENILNVLVKGRKITATVNNITGSTENALCKNPIDVITHLLTKELKYIAADFETANFALCREYADASGNYEVDYNSIPEVAFSYGIDDDQKDALDFIYQIGYHFNFYLYKTLQNKFDVINIFSLYFDIETLKDTAHHIYIDDICFLKDNSQIELNLYQSGSDLIYNDFEIKYYRNNATDKYTKTYKLEDSAWVLLFENDTLLTARKKFYHGKRKTKTIESPFIYNEDDAHRLAIVEAWKYCGVFVLAEFNLPYYYYSYRLGLSAQFKPGDIISLEGDYKNHAITNNPMIIQKISIADNAQKINILAKSVYTISAYSA